MISFSVNARIDSEEKAKRVAALIEQLKGQNSEYVADAFFNIAEGNSDRVSLTEFSNKMRKIEKNAKIEELASNQVMSLLTEDEMAAGFEGISEISDPFDYEDEVIANADTEYFVETFLDVREFLFFQEGVDIWRMLSLVRRGDPIVGNKLRWVAYKYGVARFLNEYCCNIRYVNATQQILGRG